MPNDDHPALDYGAEAARRPAEAVLPSQATKSPIAANGDRKKKLSGPPAVCRREVLRHSPEILSSAAEVLEGSLSMATLYKKLKGKVKIIKGEIGAADGDELGRTGRSAADAGNRNLVVLQFAWTRIESRFRLASIISHEYAHAEQALTRGFVAPESAPFLDARQFIILRWWSEYDAFHFQADVLEEIARSKPELRSCADSYLADDERLKALAEGKTKAAQALIAASYHAFRLGSAHAGFAKVTDAERTALTDVKNRVNALLASAEWKEQERRWKAHLP